MGLNSDFTFFSISCLTKTKEPYLSYYLAIAEGITSGFILFLRALAQSEMQTALSKIWTLVTNFISNNDDCYAKCSTFISPTPLPWALPSWLGLLNTTLSVNVLDMTLTLSTCKGPIYGSNHHHHVAPLARISLTLSHHPTLSFIASGRSSGLHPVLAQSCCMQVWPGHSAFARPCKEIHRSTSLMSLSLLLQQSPACLVHIILIVFVMGGKQIYSIILKIT